MKTTSAKIRSRLDFVTIQFIELLREQRIKRMSKPSFGAIILPEYYFEKPSPVQRNIQLDLINQYEKISELLKIIFKNAPADITYQLTQADKLYRMWMLFETNWSIEPDAEKNVQKFIKDAEEFNPLIDILDTNKNKETIIIPDTNSLLISCNPLDYKNVLNMDSFTILLLPTVLSELDKLKILHRNQDVRDKTQKVITRIKGWRNQGSLTNGVLVEKTISIKTIPNEPNMNSTLSWLDKDIPDDRIIASVIEIQSRFPSSVIILFTNDINLQNKAEAALIEYCDLEIN